MEMGIFNEFNELIKKVEEFDLRYTAGQMDLQIDRRVSDDAYQTVFVSLASTENSNWTAVFFELVKLADRRLKESEAAYGDA
jgi:hypothetical protein